MSELRAAGLIERSFLPGRHPIVPGSGASKPLGRLRVCIVKTGLIEQRDVTLFVLLVWTRVLTRRLTRSERERARGRLRALITAPQAQDSDLATIPATALALGQVAFQEERDLVIDLVGDLLSGDSDGLSGLDGSSFGGDGFGGGGDGGGDGGGGGGSN